MIACFQRFFQVEVPKTSHIHDVQELPHSNIMMHSKGSKDWPRWCALRTITASENAKHATTQFSTTTEEELPHCYKHSHARFTVRCAILRHRRGQFCSARPTIAADLQLFATRIALLFHKLFRKCSSFLHFLKAKSK